MGYIDHTIPKLDKIPCLCLAKTRKIPSGANAFESATFKKIKLRPRQNQGIEMYNVTFR
jgi:hypothetical protein